MLCAAFGLVYTILVKKEIKELEKAQRRVYLMARRMEGPPCGDTPKQTNKKILYIKKGNNCKSILLESMD